jgi:retinol dehydrogenase-12
MPDLTARTILITGANTGIGRATALQLAGRGAQLVLAGRSRARTQPVLDEIAQHTGQRQIPFLELDLANLASVRACAAAFLALDRPLHALINNAGLAGQRGLTDSGFERAFGVNHVGPFLLTALLTPRLRESAPARIVVVASQAHVGAHGIDWDAVRRPTRTRTGFAEYGVSKLANVLHAAELGRRLDGSGVTSYSLHPGVIASDIWRQVPAPIRWLMTRRMGSPEQGAATSVWCATDPGLAGQTGGYYDNRRPATPGPAVTPALAAELWARSESWTLAGGD